MNFRKTAMGALGIAALASGPIVWADTAKTDSTWNQQTTKSEPTGQEVGQEALGSTYSKNFKGNEVDGVVQSVDRTKHALSMIVPAGGSISVTSGPGISEVSREQDMVTLNVPVDKNATVLRSGASSSFDQLKMGDSVRASYDSTKQAITRIDARPLQDQANCINNGIKTTNP